MSDSQRVYGLHAVRALLANPDVSIMRAWALDSRHDPRLETLVGELRARAITVERLARRDLAQLLAQGVRHQGLVVEVAGAPPVVEQDVLGLLQRLPAPALLLVLDGITDPHNLGACLRSAEAAGVQAVILPKDKSAGLTPVVRKVACGAAERVPVLTVTNLARTLRQLQTAGVWLYGAAGEAEQTLYEVDLTAPLAWIMGAEGGGLRRLTREHCDALVRIPMAGTVESLNVAVATGVCLFETRRQRQQKAE